MNQRVVSRATVTSYRDLRIWQVAMDLAVESYRLSELLPSPERFGLVAQIRRASTSIPANIAEGHGRLLRGEYLHHLSMARGSLKDLETLLAVAERFGYVSPGDLATSAELCDFLKPHADPAASITPRHRRRPPPSARAR